MTADSALNNTPPVALNNTPPVALNDTPPAVISSDPIADGQPDPVADGQAQHLDTTGQATANDSPAPPPTPPGESPTEPARGVGSWREMMHRDSTSITLVAVLASGGVFGAILGALSASGLVIGLLVAGLTIVLSARLRRYARSA